MPFLLVALGKDSGDGGYDAGRNDRDALQLWFPLPMWLYFGQGGAQKLTKEMDWNEISPVPLLGVGSIHIGHKERPSHFYQKLTSQVNRHL